MKKSERLTVTCLQVVITTLLLVAAIAAWLQEWKVLGVVAILALVGEQQIVRVYTRILKRVPKVLLEEPRHD